LPIYVNIFIGRNGATNVLDEEHQPEIGDANVGNHFMEDFANTKTIVSRIKIVTTKVVVSPAKVPQFQTRNVFANQASMVKRVRNHQL